VIFCVFYLSMLSAFAQTDTTDNEGVIYCPTYTGAKFPGGRDSMLQYVTTHLVYPDIDWVDSLNAMVQVRFDIEVDGSLSNVHITSTKLIGFGIEDAVLKMIKEMPSWMPGTWDGKPVKSTFQLPIRFKL
jgi:hypothetical protein